ncbi:MAG: hypothetical protein Q8R55_00495 [Candidatus Taylorbacteria bacterium]|nr:hypothetical protein [Candidatus Taylorbacteria bacterium]
MSEKSDVLNFENLQLKANSTENLIQLVKKVNTMRVNRETDTRFSLELEVPNGKKVQTELGGMFPLDISGCGGVFRITLGKSKITFDICVEGMGRDSWDVFMEARGVNLELSINKQTNFDNMTEVELMVFFFFLVSFAKYQNWVIPEPITAHPFSELVKVFGPECQEGTRTEEDYGSPRITACFKNLPIGWNEWKAITTTMKEKGLSIEGSEYFGGQPINGQSFSKYLFTIPEREVLQAQKIFSEFCVPKTNSSLLHFLDKPLNQLTANKKENGGKTTENQVSKVQELVKQSFGKHARGNATQRPIVLDVENRYGSTNGLWSIVTKKFWGITSEFPVGNFLNQTGDKLEVISRYKKQAEKYAQLYKEEFGQSVSINYVQNLTQVYGHELFGSHGCEVYESGGGGRDQKLLGAGKALQRR